MEDINVKVDVVKKEAEKMQDKPTTIEATKDAVKEAANAKVGAKGVSLISMIIAGVWIILLVLIKAFWGVFGTIWGPLKEVEFYLDVGDILFSGVVLAAVFTPVYFSIILDKVKEIRRG